MMLTLPNKDNCDVKRVFRALSASSSKESLHSPPWTTSREKSSHPLSKSVGAADLPKTFSLPWKPQPKGSYAPGQEASTSYAYVADLSAELPVLSKEVYVLAEGDLLGSGVINIYEDNENKLVGSDLFVDVKMYYDDPMALKMTEISYAHSPKHENGVRIHTSPATKPTPINRHITINIRIPRSTGSEPLSLPAFRTHLPNFTHTVGDLGGIARFASVTLSSADKALIVKSLAARRIRLRTTNGSIEGAFVADEYVSLRTVNASVNADVVLSSNGQSPGVLEVISSNAEITANVALDSTAPEGKTPVFRVLTKSANKPVDLKVISVPSGADTNIDVQTTNALATVRLPLTYEGKFDLHSTPYKPVVNVSEDVKDPSGLVRRREVKNDRERRGLLTGSVAWVWHEGAGAPEPVMKGNVSVKTSNAEAQLFL